MLLDCRHKVNKRYIAHFISEPFYKVKRDTERKRKRKEFHLFHCYLILAVVVVLSISFSFRHLLQLLILMSTFGNKCDNLNCIWFKKINLKNE